MKIIPRTVSVIIPTYKHSHYILATLNSVFAQTFTDYEVIVINDGSPDDTAKVLQSLVQTGKIRYIEQKNQGQSAARNRGISEARGEFIALLDDDDLWPPDKLQWQVDALNAAPEAVLVYGKVKCLNDQEKYFTPLDEDGKPYYWLHASTSGDVREILFERNFIVTPGQCLIRQKALQTLGPEPFDIKIKGGCDDWELYLRLANLSKFIFKEKLAIIYRMHANNASNNIAALRWSSLMVRRKLIKLETDPLRRSQLKERSLLFEMGYVEAIRKQLREKTLNERGIQRCLLILRLLSLPRSLLLPYFWEFREKVGSLKSGKQAKLH